MRTRSQRENPQSNSKGDEEAPEGLRQSHGTDDNKNLSNISQDAVGKLLKRVNKGFKKEDVGYLRQSESASKESNQAKLESDVNLATPYACDSGKYDEDSDDSLWEDGSMSTLPSEKFFQGDSVNGVSVEFDVSHASTRRKPVQRATAEEKEVAELVHKAHLLCLLGRGRLMDKACDDPLIQASLLSLVPSHLLKIADCPKLTATSLTPLVSWLRNNFHVSSSSVADKSCDLALASTLEIREGTPEAVAALSVALFRALNLTARFVSILDVASLKPDKSESTCEGSKERKGDIFSSSTLMVAEPCASADFRQSSNKTAVRGAGRNKPGSSTLMVAEPCASADFHQSSNKTAVRGAGRNKPGQLRKPWLQDQDSVKNDNLKVKMSDSPVSKAPADIVESCLVNPEGLKRRGDLEFEMQLEMALAATAVGSDKLHSASDASESPCSSSVLTQPSKRMKKLIEEESQSFSNGIPTAIGSKKVGAPLYWAEVFCSGENMTGKWVHVDAANAIVDGEDKVETAAAACKKSLRYVVAFAGNGAKDVTRRYCTKWYTVAPKRINSAWWLSVLAPLKELETGATSGFVNIEPKALGNEEVEESRIVDLDKRRISDINNSSGRSEEHSPKTAPCLPMRNTCASTRSSLEEMELETRALTEPLPTNQQAYRNHQLYVIERWLKKYEVLYPKGPVLGFCAGHAVYPRTCVQALHTKERWLQEGVQVKAGEVPAKVLKRALKLGKDEAADDDDCAEGNLQGITDLYGKWQTETLCLPRAVNGIVPKNERGQVEVWSEKCLPPGTVHLGFPRVARIARMLDIDFAPAMVGFEFRNGCSAPLFDGIVVCTEFKDTILAAYLEEEGRREAEERRKNESQALSMWYQLLSSIVTRQRLKNCYLDGASSLQSLGVITTSEEKCSKPATADATTPQKIRETRTNKRQRVKTPAGKCDTSSASSPIENHEHEFVLDDQVSDEDGSTRIKRCRCGFSIQFEEL